MRLLDFKHRIEQNLILATFIGNILKLKVTESFELSFERLGGKYMPDVSSNKGSVWSFPDYISAVVLEEIIRNTCFNCGGLMKEGQALDNTYVISVDFPGQTDFKGCTQSKIGQPNIVNVSKCISCGHSHT